VSLVAFQKGKVEVIATEFDQNLGGRNIDMMLAQRFAAEFQKKHNIDVCRGSEGNDQADVGRREGTSIFL